MSTLGSRMQELREKRGWTKTYAAKQLGIKTMSTYANWEYDLRQPDNEMLLKIADLYEVTTDYLLDNADIQKQSTELKNDEFDKWLNDPRSKILFKEFNESSDEQKEALLKMWEILKGQGKL
ncbi:helix-turn-helix transcriptional regulator [Psychrobacillus sp. NEAU-3TGS]|uniref:helix-turn-helix domain-containing protein n=1 Tax=Psychrobacillus sp. NEAU-3TGS TaxID=2995412 RepID=UPI0024967F09|nr:helix-turn-helix transcriptional regulator [Psychrobacillus sp. NEAU-3TGS]MDI2588092.1 helix-turn-helix transcriptional regulator [Psychrobacillus sp. NEAU-3TGS]